MDQINRNIKELTLEKLWEREKKRSYVMREYNRCKDTEYIRNLVGNSR